MTPEEKERLLKKAQEAKARKQAQQTASSRSKTKEELEKDIASGKVNVQKTKTLPDGTTEITTADGKKIYVKGSVQQTAGKKKKLSDAKGSGKQMTEAEINAYLDGICKSMKSGSLQNYTAEELAGKAFDKKYISRMKGCETMTGEKKETIEAYELEEEPVDQTTQVTDEEQGEEEVKKGEWNPLYTRLVKEDAPWWAQDLVKMYGAAGDLARVKRYFPWQKKPIVNLPGVEYYDPNRELAANAEQANIQTQGLAAFTGPQALSARSSQIQGQALKNAADIMARYNNLNVGLGNELEQQRTNILNTAYQNEANMDTQLWDKYTILNQQFDNSKALARQELRKAFIDGITNRAKAQALNSLYPNYHTDPSSGGFVDFVNTGYKPTPENQGADYTDQLWEKAKQLNPNNPTEVFKILYSRKKSADGDDYSEYLANQGYS